MTRCGQGRILRRSHLNHEPIKVKEQARHIPLFKGVLGKENRRAKALSYQIRTKREIHYS